MFENIARARTSAHAERGFKNNNNMPYTALFSCQMRHLEFNSTIVRVNARKYRPIRRRGSSQTRFRELVIGSIPTLAQAKRGRLRQNANCGSSEKKLSYISGKSVFWKGTPAHFYLVGNSSRVSTAFLCDSLIEMELKLYYWKYLWHPTNKIILGTKYRIDRKLPVGVYPRLRIGPQTLRNGVK